MAFVRGRAQGRLQRCFVRSVVSNPALNTNPAFRNPAIMPFGMEFIDDDLRQKLNAENEEIADKVESLYFRQCQEDAELNGTRLPRAHDSRLWGFIYGQRLVSAQHELDTLSDDEQFMANRLRETVAELEMKMKRYFPDLDYRAQIAAAKRERPPCSEHTECRNEAMATLMARDPAAFVAVFQNNAFIPPRALEEDQDDKFGDFLPLEVEQALLSRFEVEWAFGSNLTSSFEPYFERMARMEAVVSPKVDSLSKNLRRHFGGFLTQCFERNELDDVRDVVRMVEAATSSVLTDDVRALSKDEAAAKTLGLLEEMGSAAPLIQKLFFGQKEAESALAAKSRDELLDTLRAVDPERLVLANQSLQMFLYLRHHSLSRLFLSVAVSECPDYFGQFLNGLDGEDNIARFESANSAILDEAVTALSAQYEEQDHLLRALAALQTAVEGQVGSAVALNLSSFPAAPCWLTGLLEAATKEAEGRGSVVDQLRYLTYSKLVARCPSKVSGLRLLSFLLSPSRDGVDGEELKNAAFGVATDSAAANELLFGQIAEGMAQSARTDSVSSFKSSLSSAVEAELEQFRTACGRYNAARLQLEKVLQRVQFKFEELNFDHAKSNYDPLSTYLANFRYFTKYQ